MSQRLLRNVFQRALRDQRRALVGFGVGLVAYALLIASFYPTVRDSREAFQQLLDAYPPAFKTAFGITDLTSAPDFVHAELFGVMVPLLFLLYAIGRAADAIAGEEERGQLDVLLTHPVSRRRVLAQKAAALALGLTILAGLLWLSLAAGSALVGMGLDLVALAEEVLLLLLLSCAMAALTLLAGCVRGRKGFALAVGSGITVVAYLLHSFGAIVDALGTIRKASPFYAYAGSAPLVAPFVPLHAAALAVLALAATAAAFWAFERRDVGV